ncbi:hypothetical protein scyTo_0000649 [Scyliorhinus torazame]|uniref:Uncharacterized protein n=1 Tax=Scyliorhinus torazame TaxID=75743 RepID=A0A401P127_SCYTO|nr:hypothetical protein [Scyliorhinus torazame]
MAEVHNLQELRPSASLATKVFIQRDYADGILCQFQTKFPPELESRIINFKGSMALGFTAKFCQGRPLIIALVTNGPRCLGALKALHPVATHSAV